MSALKSKGLLALVYVSTVFGVSAQDVPVLTDVESQPLVAQVRRVAQALDLAGAPLDAVQRAALESAMEDPDPVRGLARIQSTLDPLCLAFVHVNPESRVKVAPGAAPRELVQHGWRVFLVKVANEAGVTAPLRCSSPQALRPFEPGSDNPAPTTVITEAAVRDRWLELRTLDRQPLHNRLSGLALEYRLVQLYSRDAGQREAKLAFDVGQGTQDLGFRGEANLLFTCRPAVRVTLNVLDHDGEPTTGQFVFRDPQGRVYPDRSRRLAPDFFFHDQVYRSSGETILLSPGEYRVAYARGPEYRTLERTIRIPHDAGEEHAETFRLERWIDPAARGWFSGDHHVHAAGCAHYEAPEKGVPPDAMMRHIIGEGLNVGCVLTWGPCWYSQKQFFEGAVSALSTQRHLMRYDVEVSGFPSSHAGHVCLLRLSEDDYPGTHTIAEWPSWDLPVLQWGKSQGGIVGFSHSGFGLQVSGATLPTYEMPPFDGIGANEYIVDVVHGAVDFISAVDTPSIWELNIWYHTLNCGFTTRISGETDFPCIYGERVGMGRSYVKLPDGVPLDFDAWVLGMRDGRSYVSDGLSHLMDFEVGGLAVGTATDGGRASVLALEKKRPLAVRAKVAALLAEQPRDDVRMRPLDAKPYWHVERARVGNTRKVSVELVVNGHAVQRKEITADGTLVDVAFTFEPAISSWVALRIFPSSHTNPVFVELDERPVRASRKSAEWCAEAVEVCWNSKSRGIRRSERKEARAAYEVAARKYKEIAREARTD